MTVTGHKMAVSNAVSRDNVRQKWFQQALELRSENTASTSLPWVVTVSSRYQTLTSSRLVKALQNSSSHKAVASIRQGKLPFILVMVWKHGTHALHCTFKSATYFGHFGSLSLYFQTKKRFFKVWERDFLKYCDSVAEEQLLSATAGPMF